MSKFWIIGLLFLSACTTAQVTQDCSLVKMGVGMLPPLPMEAGLAVTVVGIGATVCASDSYARGRDHVIDWYNTP